LDYWKYHNNVKELLKLEKKKVFPPRFKLQYVKTDPSVILHAKIMISKRSNAQTLVVGNFKGSEGVYSTVFIIKTID